MSLLAFHLFIICQTKTSSLSIVLPPIHFILGNLPEEDYPEFHIPNEPNIITKYTVGRHGTIAVQRAYEEISTLHSIDATLAVDGGVDSLSKGNEEDHGTILEDFIALAALKNGVLACAGFGTETEENLNHYRILQNIANLAAKGYFLGSFSMTKEMPEFQKYAQVCEATWEQTKEKATSKRKLFRLSVAGLLMKMITQLLMHESLMPKN